MADFRRFMYAPIEWLCKHAFDIIRGFLIGILTIGPIPCHVAFIMDGNRRYAKIHNLTNEKGHKAGYESLMELLKQCTEIGIKYVTAYAFSIDNFKRPVDEVESLMKLFTEKIQSMSDPDNIIHKHGFRFRFVGNLNLLNQSLRTAVENATMATACNDRGVLSVCIAYTSTNEILNAVHESCAMVMRGSCYDGGSGVSLDEIEKRTWTAEVPDPDLLIRSSGQTRLSNFLLWQTSNCLLYKTAAFWPEVGRGRLIWALLNYQRSCWYLRKKVKQV